VAERIGDDAPELRKAETRLESRRDFVDHPGDVRQWISRLL